MKFGTLAAAVTVSIAVGLPAGAQEKAMEKAPGNDPVVAIVNGDKIFRSDLDTARGQLPDQYRNLPMDQLFTPLVNQLVRSKLMAGEARSEKLHVSEGYLKRLALIRELLLEEALLDKIITARVTDMRAKYEKSVADFPSGRSPCPAYLGENEGEAKALVAIRWRRRFRETGGGQVDWPVEIPGRRSGLFRARPDGSTVRKSRLRSG